MGADSWDLGGIASDLQYSGDNGTFLMNVRGIGHVFLPTMALTNILYNVVIKNKIQRCDNILINLYTFTMIGQLINCFGFQIEFLYYGVPDNNTSLLILGVLFCKNIGFITITYGTFLSCVCYYFIGVYHNVNRNGYAVVHNIVFKYGVIGYLLFGSMWLTLVCFYGPFAYILFIIFIPLSTISQLTFYTLLGKKSPFVDTNDDYYKVGFYGSILEAFNFTVWLVVCIFTAAIPNTLAGVLIGLSHSMVNVGINYLSTLEMFNDVRKKAKKSPMESSQQLQVTQMAPNVSDDINLNIDLASTQALHKSVNLDEMVNAGVVEDLDISKMNQINEINQINQINEMNGQLHFVKNESTRWDLVMLYYFLALYGTGCSFGASHNGEFNRGIFFWTFIHFSAETTVSIHLLSSRNENAKRYCVFFAFIWLGQAFFLVPVLSWSYLASIFLLQFIFSDSLNGVVAFSSMMNSVPYYGCLEIKKISFGIFIHFCGVSLALWILPITLYWDDKIPQHGLAWVLIAYFGAISLYFCKDALQSKINYIDVASIKWQFDHHHDDAYDHDNDGKYNKYGKKGGNNINYQKYAIRAAIIIPTFIVIVVFMLARYRTTTSTTGFSYASWIWEDAILATGFALSSFVFILTLFLWAKGRTQRNLFLAKQFKNVHVVNIDTSDNERKE